MLLHDAVPEHQFQFRDGIQSENGQPAGNQLRRSDGVGHFYLPRLLELIAGSRVSKTGTGLLHGQGGTRQHQHVVRTVQKGHQVALLFRDDHIRVLREALARLIGEAGTADDKKPLHAIGQ